MESVTINRAPVLTLWAAVVAERLGFDHDEALTLGKAVAGLTAQSKGQRLGLFTPSPAEVRRKRAEKAREAGVFSVALLGRAVPVLHTDDGLRAVSRDQKPVTPEGVEKYLESKFGEALPAVRAAMVKLATSRAPEGLVDEAFRLYEQFRPGVPAGESGWGAKGTLSLQKIQTLAEKQETRGLRLRSRDR
jgi:hypothetical protein